MKDSIRSDEIWQEYTRLYVEGKTQELRQSNPNGLHRLKHLVPRLAPDQASLARGLAGLALQHRAPDLADDEPLQAYLRFQEAKKSNTALAMLVREARSRSRKAWIAWRACAMFLPADARSGFEWTDGAWQKVVMPIPDQIQTLMQDCFIGAVDRPKPKRTGPRREQNEMRDDVIRFAVWSALEADIKATSRSGKPSACSIVADILQDMEADTVADIWKRRAVAPKKST